MNIPDCSNTDYLSNLSAIKSHLYRLKRVDGSERFETIHFKGYAIQISAGILALSTPTDDYDSLEKYSHVQIFLYDSTNYGEDSFSFGPIAPISDPKFNQFVWAKYFQYQLFGAKTLTASHMAKHVPIDDTCKIIRDVYKVSQFEIFT